MAVRRSRPLISRAGLPDLPEHLRQCWIEDWVDLDEIPPDWWWSNTSIDVNDWSGEMSTYLAIIARGRWWDARREWAEAHGMTEREFRGLFETSRPRWRDWHAYAARRSWAPPKRTYV